MIIPNNYIQSNIVDDFANAGSKFGLVAKDPQGKEAIQRFATERHVVPPSLLKLADKRRPRRPHAEEIEDGDTLIIDISDFTDPVCIAVMCCAPEAGVLAFETPLMRNWALLSMRVRDLRHLRKYDAT